MPEVLVHLNINTDRDDVTAEEISEQIMGALEVGIDADQTPDLYSAGIIAPLVEVIG